HIFRLRERNLERESLPPNDHSLLPTPPSFALQRPLEDHLEAPPPIIFPALPTDQLGVSSHRSFVPQRPSEDRSLSSTEASNVTPGERRLLVCLPTGRVSFHWSRLFPRVAFLCTLALVHVFPFNSCFFAVYILL
ncbi:hypothetical protein V8G54_003217, partial [Vigna mungo]